MYGQTEATARMAYLPPELAAARPEAIGVPIPGGALRIEPVPRRAEPGVGELVYTGPNVMLGYADVGRRPGAGAGRSPSCGPATSARSATASSRSSGGPDRHAKLFGLRLDLDRVEEIASTSAPPVWCVVAGDTLHAFTTRPRRTDSVRARVAAARGAAGTRPSGSTVLPSCPGPPPASRTGRCWSARQSWCRTPSRAEAPVGRGPATARGRRATSRARPRPSRRTVDSTSSGSAATRSPTSSSPPGSAGRLGDLPADWHTRTVAELAPAAGAGRGVRLDPTVLLRALGDRGDRRHPREPLHGDRRRAPAARRRRLQLRPVPARDAPRAARVRNGLVATAQVAVPSALFIAAVALATGAYDLRTALFLNGLVGSDRLDRPVAVLVPRGAGVDVPGARGPDGVPAVDRWSGGAVRVAAALLAVALVVRFAWVGVEAGPTERYTVGVVAWCFVAGWAPRGRRTPRTGSRRDRGRGRRVLRRPAARARWWSLASRPWPACPRSGCRPGSRRAGRPGRVVAVRLPDALAGLPHLEDGPPAAGDARLVRCRDRLLAGHASAGPSSGRRAALTSLSSLQSVTIGSSRASAQARAGRGGGGSRGSPDAPERHHPAAVVAVGEVPDVAGDRARASTRR